MVHKVRVEVSKGEVGKLLSFLGTAYNLGIVVGTVGSGTIYYNTVAFFPGTMFLVFAGFVAVAWLSILAAHLLSTPQYQ